MAQTYDAIASYTFGSAASSYTFSSIAASWTDLILVQSTKFTSGTQNTLMQVGNGSADTGSNYSQTYISGNGTSASSGRTTSLTGIYAGNSTDTSFTSTIWHLQNYANASVYKTILHRTNDAGIQALADVGLWRSTSAINTITLTATGSSFVAGSTLSLYGVKSA